MAGQTSTHPFNAVGIDVGSVNVKVCGLAAGAARAAVVAHEGDIESALDKAFADARSRQPAAPPAVATGGAGRHRLDVADVIAPSAIEAALDALGLRPRAVVSLGGEDLVVYVLDGRGRVQTTYAGNKCASGTGEFFRQQLGRMDLRLEDLDEVTDGARVLKLSARCSVFMKSDCTHRLNKGEATQGRHRPVALQGDGRQGRRVPDQGEDPRTAPVVLIGGVTQNRHLVRFLARGLAADSSSSCPREARYFEAFGAAHLAGALGRPLAPRGRLVRPFQPAAGTPFAPLAVGGVARHATTPRGAARCDPTPSTCSASTAARRRPRSR